MMYIIIRRDRIIMQKGYKVLWEGGEGELVEKKSRFLAAVSPVKSEEEALTFIEGQRKKYWDARHHCFAYVLGDQNQVQRCSDDGEPSQTAGRPILDVVLGEEIHDVCVVVTRYFGGTLLGTGGLVRAYSGAAKEGLLAGRIMEKCLGRRLSILTDYTGVGKIQYILGQRNITLLESRYEEQVEFQVMAPEAEADSLVAEITEATSGRAILSLSDPEYYGVVDGEVLIL